MAFANLGGFLRKDGQHLFYYRMRGRELLESDDKTTDEKRHLATVDAMTKIDVKSDQSGDDGCTFLLEHPQWKMRIALYCEQPRQARYWIKAFRRTGAKLIGDTDVGMARQTLRRRKVQGAVPTQSGSMTSASDRGGRSARESDHNTGRGRSDNEREPLLARNANGRVRQRRRKRARISATDNSGTNAENANPITVPLGSVAPWRNSRLFLLVLLALHLAIGWPALASIFSCARSDCAQSVENGSIDINSVVVGLVDVVVVLFLVAFLLYIHARCYHVCLMRNASCCAAFRSICPTRGRRGRYPCTTLRMAVFDATILSVLSMCSFGIHVGVVRILHYFYAEHSLEQQPGIALISSISLISGLVCVIVVGVCMARCGMYTNTQQQYVLLNEDDYADTESENDENGENLENEEFLYSIDDEIV